MKMLTRVLVGVVTVLSLCATGCGGDDATVEAATLVTVGDLGLDLPFSVPADIPAPSDGQFVGQPPADPWSAIQIGSTFDPESLRAAVRTFGDSVDGSRFDDSLGQVTYETEIDGVRHSVYIWVRTNADVDLSTLLEIGTVESE